jgi:hypothetical protein
VANQITDNRTQVSSADTATDFVDLGGSVSSVANNEDTEFKIEGLSSVGEVIGTSLGGQLYNAGTPQNYSNNTFYIWAATTIAGVLDTKANGGFRIRFCGGTITDFFEVYVAGAGDEWPAAISGGWVQFVVDIEEARSQAVTNGWTGGTTPATSSIQYVGFAAVTNGAMVRMVNNCWIDEIRRLPTGTPGIIVEGRNGGTTDWTSADIASTLGLSTGTFIETTAGAYKINTPIQFGINDTTTHAFTDTNKIWLWDTQEFIPDGFYSISALGNSGGTTNVTLGAKAGTGDAATGAQGLTIAAASNGKRWDMDLDDPNLDGINFYGCSFQHGGTFQLDDAAVEVISTLYIDCTQAVVQDSLQLRNTVVAPANGDGVAFMVTDDFLDIRFTTFNFLDGHAIEITAQTVNPQENRGNLFNGAFSTTPGSTDAAMYNNSGSGQLTIDNTNSTNLNINSYRNGTSASTLIQNSVTVQVTVQDTTGTPIQNAKVFLEEDPGGTDVISFGVTDVNGEVSTTFSGSVPQDVIGYVSKGTSSPVYKRANINDTIGTGGLSATITLVSDE